MTSESYVRGFNTVKKGEIKREVRITNNGKVKRVSDVKTEREMKYMR
jgi:hypothetical protein